MGIPAVAEFAVNDNSAWNASKVVGILDHHALQLPGKTSTKPEFFYDVLDGQIVEMHAWGCGCTIIALKFRDSGATPTRAAAGLMLGGILSDTLGLTSPTTTDLDWQAVTYLKQQANISDVDSFFDRQAIAKSSQNLLAPLSQTFEADLKEYVVTENRSLVIGAIEMYGEENYEAMLKKCQGSEGIDAWKKSRSRPAKTDVFIWVVDTKNKKSTLMTDKERGLCVANTAKNQEYVKQISKECRDDTVDEAFSTDFAVFVPFGQCVSRKLQAQPLLTAAIQQEICE